MKWSVDEYDVPVSFLPNKKRARSKPIIMFPTNKVAVFDDTVTKVLVSIPPDPETD